jgi:hypothetical protein
MDGGVGYKRPPKHAQWKKGQCGNPKRQYRRRATKGTLAAIDEILEEPIAIVEKGVQRRVSIFEAILLQLWNREMAGDTRAMHVRLKYQEFVAQRRGPAEIIVEGGGLLDRRQPSVCRAAPDERL